MTAYCLLSWATFRVMTSFDWWIWVFSACELSTPRSHLSCYQWLVARSDWHQSSSLLSGSHCRPWVYVWIVIHMVLSASSDNSECLAVGWDLSTPSMAYLSLLTSPKLQNLGQQSKYMCSMNHSDTGVLVTSLRCYLWRWSTPAETGWILQIKHIAHDLTPSFVWLGSACSMSFAISFSGLICKSWSRNADKLSSEVWGLLASELDECISEMAVSILLLAYDASVLSYTSKSSLSTALTVALSFCLLSVAKSELVSKGRGGIQTDFWFTWFCPFLDNLSQTPGCVDCAPSERMTLIVLGELEETDFSIFLSLLRSLRLVDFDTFLKT